MSGLHRRTLGKINVCYETARWPAVVLHPIGPGRTGPRRALRLSESLNFLEVLQDRGSWAWAPLYSQAITQELVTHGPGKQSDSSTLLAHAYASSFYFTESFQHQEPGPPALSESKEEMDGG